MSESKPHDSARIFSSIKKKHWFEVGSKIAQAEKPDKGKGIWVILALLIVFAVMGGLMMGLYLETNYINPPTQITGICAPPANVVGFNCVVSTTVTDAQGSEHVTTVQTGQLLGNENTQCGGSQCAVIP